MTVEILYYDYLLFGDAANADYLKKCLPFAEFIYTSISDKPHFAENPVDLIYMGGMSESNLARALSSLMPYRARFLELIEKGVHIFFTANACDILGKEIIDGDKVTPCLNVFDFTIKMNYFKRFNAMVLGKYKDFDIVGYKSHFATPDIGDCNDFFMSVERGVGNNQGCNFDGFKKNNLIATYIVGPFFIINPVFTKAYLSEIFKKEVTLPFEEDAIAAYEARLREFKDPARKII